MANLFRYISFRAIMAALFSFILVLYVMPRWIAWLRKRQVQQSIRDDGPQSHKKKAGTPAMGGLPLIGAIVVVVLLFNRLEESMVWISLLALISFGAVGLVDDILKFTKKNSKGVSFRAKMLWLGGLSVLVSYLALSWVGLGPTIAFPFLKAAQIDIGLWFLLWGFLVLNGASNAVNLTDGLDGLAIVPIMTTAFVLLVMAYVAGHSGFSSYLHFDFLAGGGELAIGMAAVIGAGLGFLWFNAHPAEIFMGDVGALGLGAYLGAVALLTKKELILVIAGFLFVLEALSVMLQVGVFKIKKRRIFRMAPLHHHFELGGWPESKVIVRFWILSVIFALAALSALKIR